MDSTYKIMKQALNGSMKRQEVILNNLANLNTKNFKAKEYDFQTELKRKIEERDNVSKKHPQGQYIAPEIIGKDGIKYKTEGITGRDGNNVDLNAELIDLTENQMYYNGLVQQVNKKIGIRRYVINGR